MNRSDVVAGVVAGAVVLPQAMGYAGVAGLPVQVGLYTCIVPMAAYALLGGARRLSMSTTSTIVALAGLALAAAGTPDDPDAAMAAVSTLTLLTGLALLLFWLLRLGWVVDAISDTVVSGLKVGVGLTIIVDQLPHLLGIDAGPDGFLRGIEYTLTHLADANRATVVVAVLTLAGLWALRRWAPRVPGPLLAVAGGIAATAWADLPARGVELIPPVPSGLPAPAVPPLDGAWTMLPYALAIALMAFMETIAVGRSTREPLDPPIATGRELLANGTAAVAGAFVATAPPAGGFSQTMVNVAAGARTQLSSLVTAGVAVAAALFLAPVLSDLPEATLAAVVVVAVAGLLDVRELRRIGRIDRVELVVALTTGGIAVLTNLLAGVVAGVFLTYYLVLRRLNHPVLAEHRPAPGLLVVRIEGALYTMNVRAVQAELVRRATTEDPPPRVLLLDLGATLDTSVTVMDAFAAAEQQLAQHDVALWVADLPEAALVKARRTAAWPAWRDGGRVHPTVRAAVDAYEGLVTEGPDGAA
ncbi:SulP family inorganic anion transporter [Jiangella endophytica]|uniref:SulP family inorganic anion transporter n=1 Tax=Jiangella endophytica TaxID=1623398 RepID=UPI000E351F75|nr:SulP family inorganic anion transporter [Jiangella endophytica]